MTSPRSVMRHASTDRRDATRAAPADPRLPALLADLRVRLRLACRDWPEAEFEAVILKIALRKTRWLDGGYVG